MFSLYLALSIKTKCAERWSERRDRVSFGNISALRAFAFCVLWTRFQTFMILDSLVSHIPRALAEYSLLLGRRTGRLAGLRTQTFFEF